MAVQISGNDITVPRDGTFTRNVTIGGTLTYEDVTNIDSVGLITARTGIEIGARPGVAASISVDGNMIVSGISTFGGDVFIADKIIHDGDTNTAIRFPEGDHISFEVGLTGEAIRIDNGGKLLIGLETRRLFASGHTSQLQIEGTNSTLNSSLSIVNNQDSTGSPNIRLGKTRGTSIGSNTSVADGDQLGQIIFYGADGTDIYNATALIGAEVNGTVGTDTIPTDLVFQTSATTGSGRAERLRITSDGKVGIGSDDPQENLDIRGAGASVIRLTTNNNLSYTNLRQNQTGKYFEISPSSTSNQSFIVNKPNGDEALRITSGGQVLTGHDTASSNFHDPQTTVDRTPNIQIHGGNSVAASAALVSWNSNTGSYYSNALFLAHSGSSTIGTNSIVSGSNTLGSIVFSGDDGDEFVKGAMISAHVDGTPGADDMPTRLQFFTNGGSDAPSERMRITADGSVIVGYAGDISTMFFVGMNNSNYVRIDNINANTNAIIVRKAVSTTYAAIRMVNTNGHRGSLNVTNSGVALANASDYRLKENETTISDGITRVKQLIPRRFNFKTDSTTVDGFFAHEVSPVVPESVFGEKDSTINEEGDGYQMLDQSKLIPVLTASIKELIAKVETLEAEVAALKSN